MPAGGGDFWIAIAQDLRDASPRGYAKLLATYPDGAGGLDLQPFFDLITIHELGHAFEVLGDLRLPTFWLSEIFVNLALHAFVKPFDFAELVARVRALARRAVTPLPPTLECGDVTLDCGRRVAFRAGRRLELSPKELAVLECLLSSQDRALSAEELLERAWDAYTDPFTTAVKTTIRRLRAKLGDPPMIHTVREAGYRIGPE